MFIYFTGKEKESKGKEGRRKSQLMARVLYGTVPHRERADSDVLPQQCRHASLRNEANDADNSKQPCPIVWLLPCIPLHCMKLRAQSNPSAQRDHEFHALQCHAMQCYVLTCCEAYERALPEGWKAAAEQCS